MRLPTVEEIRAEFIEGSGIAPDVFEAAVRIVSDEVIDPLTHEVIAEPIEESLGWRRGIFGHRPRYNLLAAQFIDENGEVWQQKVYGDLTPKQDGKRSGLYRARTGVGDSIYLPPLPRTVIENTAKTYGLELPGPDESGWDWVKRHKQIPVVVTEGGKKALSAIGQGVITVAVFGCGCGVKDLMIKEALFPYVEGRPVYIALDQDPLSKPKARKAVKKGINRLASALTYHAKAKAKIVTWKPEQGKAIDDLIARDPAEFHQALQRATTLEEWRIQGFTDLTPYITHRVNERYLTTLPDFTGHRLIALKSFRGSGKTEVLKRIVAEAIAKGIPVIVIVHREQLARQMASRLGLPYRTEYRDGEARGDMGYVLCIDSLHSGANPPFYPSDWEDCLVIVDEAEQVFWHGLSSTTCQKNRVAILETLGSLFSLSQQVILADADLSAISVNYALSLIGEPVEPVVILNEYRSQEKRELVFYESSDSLLAHVVEMVDQGKKVIIHTGAAKPQSPWGTKNLESILSSQGLRVLRIDADSVSDPWHPACGVMGDINEVLPHYDVVIASPTMETGVSIDIKGHFDERICFASGVQTAEAVCQSTARLREPVPLHMTAPKQSKRRIGNGSTDPRALLRSTNKAFKANHKLLSLADQDADLDGETRCHVTAWARYAAKLNYEFKNYRREILSNLEDEGHSITCAEARPEDKAHGVVARDLAKMCYREECEQIAAAPTLSPYEYERLSRQQLKTQGEKRAERKTSLVNTYATWDITPELVERDDTSGWYPGLRLQYFLTVGRCFLEQRDKAKLKEIAPEGKAFAPDVNRTMLSVKVKALELIQIEQFLETGRVFTSDSLTDWYEMILRFRFDLKEALGITINPERDTPIGAAQRLLGLLGLRLACLGQRRQNGKRIREYQMQNLDPDDRQSIFARWLERDERRSLEDTPLVA